MSDEWLETTLGEVADITIGKTPPRNEPKYWTTALDYPFCTIADMTDLDIDPVREGVTEAAIVDKKAKRVPAGALLMSFKLSIGRIGFASRDIFPNEAIAWLNPKTDNIDKRYLGYWLSAQDLTTGSGRAVKGSTLNGPSLRAIEVRMPPLPIQRRIVDLLTHVDAHIANLQAEATSAFKARMAYLSTAVRAPAANGTNERTLRSLATWRGGLTPSKSEPTYWFPGDVPWVSSKEVVGTVLRGTEKLVSKRALEETSLRLVSPGSTVVVVRSGILVHTLPIAYVPFACTVNQDVKAGTPHQDVDNRFLTLLLEATASELLPTYRKTGTTVQSLNFEALLEHSFNVPPLQVQEEIADVVFEFDSAIRLMESEVKLLQDLRKSLLASLLSRKSAIDPRYDSLTRAMA